MEKLRSYMAEKGLSQRAFAEQLGIDPTVFSRVLSGRVGLSADLARAIHSATDGEVTPNDLILQPAREAAA